MVFVFGIVAVFLVGKIVMGGQIPVAPNDLGAVIAVMSKELDAESKD